ncbi:hypothetical protein OIU79_017213, partial [Salix purpurea]
MQVNFHQSTLQNFFICDLFVEVMANELFIARIKPKTRRESCSNVSQPHDDCLLKRIKILRTRSSGEDTIGMYLEKRSSGFSVLELEYKIC